VQMRRLILFMDLKNRFGTVFILIGGVLLFLFVAADFVEVENLNAWYLVFGVIFTAFGIFLKASDRKPPEESARFRTLRRLSRRGKQRDEHPPEADEGE
jgi:hypothetical protein